MNPGHQFRVLLLCSLLVAPLYAQQAQRSNVSFDEVLALPKREADARISYGPDPLQYGELWLPAIGDGEPGRPVPLLVMIHGGCWLNEFDVSHTYGFNTALAEQGYAVWALEYRRTGDAGGGWPGTFQDIYNGILTLDELAGRGVNTDPVAVLGHSAGGHLALLAATYPALAQSVDLFIGLAAIVDIEQYSLGNNTCQAATPAFMGGTLQQIPQTYEVANPVGKQLQARTVLFQGDSDQIVPLSQATLEGAETRIFEGAGHFDWIHPGTGAYANLLLLLEESF